MASWILKAAVKRTISLLPRSENWDYFFQRHVTRTAQLERPEFHRKLRLCAKHLDDYFRHSTAPVEGFVAVELGTGWFPVAALGLFLCGASSIWTIDSVSRLRNENVARVLSLFKTTNLEALRRF